MEYKEDLVDRIKAVMKKHNVASVRAFATSIPIDQSYFAKFLKREKSHGLTFEKLEAIAKKYNEDLKWLRGSEDNDFFIVDNYPNQNKTENTSISLLIESNRKLAEAQMLMAESNKLLAETNAKLVAIIESKNTEAVLLNTDPDVDEKYLKALEAIRKALPGIEIFSVEEGQALIQCKMLEELRSHLNKEDKRTLKNMSRNS